MASGGQNPSHRRTGNQPPKQARKPGSLVENPPWFSAPNNLEVKPTIPAQKSSKKQRNRDRFRDQFLAENTLSATSSSSSSARWNSLQHPVESLSTAKQLAAPTHPTSQLQMPGITRRDPGAGKGQNESNRIQGTDTTLGNRASSGANNARQESQSLHDPSMSQQGKPNNTSKSLDSTAIVERLMRLRDCIKQVVILKQNLEQTEEPMTREQTTRLDDMLDELRREEHDQLEMLQRVLCIQEENAAQLDGATSLHSEPNKQEDKGQIEDGAEAALLKRRNELLKKVIESREKLASLEQQQALLLAMQKQAESQLMEARALQEHLLGEKELPPKSNPSVIPYPGAQYAATSDDSHRVSDSAYSEDADWDGDHTPSATSKSSMGSKANDNTHVPLRDDSGNKGTQKQNLMTLTTQLGNMQKRLQLLDELGRGTETAEVLAAEEVPARPEESTADSLLIADRHRQQLENKLQELQAKKRNMDKILQQLTTLQGDEQDQPARIAPDSPPVRRSSVFQENAQDTIRQTQRFLDTVDTTEKMRNLNEMRDTICQLQAFIDNYQPSGGRNSNSEDGHTEQRALPPPTPKKEPVVPSRSRVNLAKQDNGTVELVNSFPARRHYEAEGRANEDGDATVGITGGSSLPLSGQSAPTTWSKDLSEQNNLMAKTDRAKDQLEKLQAVLATVQQLRASGRRVPKEFLDMVEAVADEEDEMDDSSDRTESVEDEMANKDGQGDGPEQMHRLKDVEQRMQQQQEELQQLLDERLQLLNMRDALQSLQTRINSTAKNNVEFTTTQAQADRCHTPSAPPEELPALPSKTRPSKTATITKPAPKSPGIRTTPKRENTSAKVISLPGRIGTVREGMTDSARVQGSKECDRNLSLRQEMQSQMDVLKELLQQEQSKQLGYSRNEDVRSFSGSSVKSEGPMYGSELAPDTTVAATWGGSSTQENFEVEEEEETAEEREDNESGSESRAAMRDLCVDQETFSSLLHTFGTGQQQQRYSSPNKPKQTKVKTQRRTPQFGTAAATSSDRTTSWNADISAKNWKKPTASVKIQTTQREEEPEVPDGPSAIPVSESSNIDPLNTWQQFVMQMNQQLENASSMFQAVAQDQQALSRLFQNPQVNSGDLIQQLSRQMQHHLLLLHLGQCYQIMHLQQLEIMQMQQCLPQISNKASGSLPPTMMFGSQPYQSTEDFILRPWFNATHMPSAQANQTSANAPSSHVPVPPTAPTPPLFTSPVNNVMGHSAPPPPVPSNSSHDGRGNTETTLNNQVPPGTRANNFWDNFRSYSRQNLLSAAAVSSKSNEFLSAGTSNSCAPTAPVRHAVSSGDIAQQAAVGRNMRTWEWVYPRGDNVHPSGTRAKDRYRERPLPNPERQELLSRPKRKNPNSNQEQQNSSSFGLHVGAPFSSNTPSSSIPNLGSSSPFVDSTKVYSAPPPCFRSLNNTSTPGGVTWNQQVPSAHGDRIREPECTGSGQGDKPFPFLVELLHQLQLLKTDTQRENLLATLQEMVAQNSSADDVQNSVQTRRERIVSANEHVAPDHPGLFCELPEFGSGPCSPDLSSAHGRPPFSQDPIALPDGTSYNTEIQSIGADTYDSASRGGGAVRKKQYPQQSLPPPSSREPQMSSTGGSDERVCATPSRFYSIEDDADRQVASDQSSDLVVDQAMADLMSFLQRHRDEECSPHIQAQICSQVLASLPSSLFFRSKLLQALQQTLTKYSGKRISECVLLLFDVKTITQKHVSIQRHKNTTDDDSTTLVPVKMANGATESSTAIQVSGHVDTTGPESDELNACQTFLHSSENQYTGFPPMSVHQRDSRMHGTDAAAKQGGDLSVEDDAGYKCDVEGETEPEVEAETEADDTKDLAEADQTPKQMGSTGDAESLGAEALSIERNQGDAESTGSIPHLFLPNGDVEGSETAGACGVSPPQHEMMYRPEGARAEEASLDDIPTKLSSSAVQEEVEKDVAEGQAATHPSQNFSNEDGAPGFEGDKGATN